MQNNSNAADQIIRDADTLIAKVQGDLDSTAEYYRSNNIDPTKIQSALAPFVGAKEKAEIERIEKSDFEAVEQEVREAAARMNFSSAPTVSASVRKPRDLV